MNTWHIHVQGQVQGVGFRPFVFRLALQENVKGWVSNAIDGVHIEISADKEFAHFFLENIIKFCPSIATITEASIRSIEDKKFDGFQIVESEKEGVVSVMLSPDFGICKACKEELSDVNNRRYGYPFISCTNCGPRYSITKSLPYDRISTTMQAMNMCEVCADEYQSPADRRYYSQINTCPTCAIKLNLYDQTKSSVATDPITIVKKICYLWGEGKIIAIKGIGGYLLTCDASNESAIVRLRELKHRPSKPFALLFPDVKSVEHVMNVSKVERVALQDSASPIVILETNNKIESNLKRQVIAPGLLQLGVMLPYTPLFTLLLDAFKKPIVATSGNISNAPIVFDDEKALTSLLSIVDYILMNNLRMVIPQDDSVVKFSHFNQHKIILRRARGMAPSYVNPKLNTSAKTILAMGAMQKSSFTFLNQGNIFISQYMGDLEDFETEENYRHTIDHCFMLFHRRPEVVLCDLHASYPSTVIAEELAEKHNIPVKKVQHHQAHFASVLGEHQLIHSVDAVLGVIWDGTGQGTDGNIWGGEFFIYQDYEFIRSGHISYFNFILADKMPKEPRLSALVMCKSISEATEMLKEKFTAQEWKIYQTVLRKTSALQSSSMGRLFDAVASLLDICNKQSYEGEAAILLEQQALEYCQLHGLKFISSYFTELSDDCTVSTESIITGILEDLQHRIDTTLIAAKFHYTLVTIIEAYIRRFKIQRVAFSGGVFQNALLVDMLYHHLEHKYKLYFNQELSPNDENISFGQLVYHQIQEEYR